MCPPVTAKIQEPVIKFLILDSDFQQGGFKTYICANMFLDKVLAHCDANDRYEKTIDIGKDNEVKTSMDVNSLRPC